jgi:hypothetical protein
VTCSAGPPMFIRAMTRITLMRLSLNVRPPRSA